VSKLRLGVIGPGLIWEIAHRPQIERLGRAYDVVAFSARSPETEERARREHPDARFYRDYRDLIQDDQVEGVVILTPIPLNAPVAMETLLAGKVAFLEKPTGTGPEEARQLCETEEQHGRRVYVLEQAPYNPVWSIVEDTIRAGRIGRVAGFEAARHAHLSESSTGTRGFGDTDWRIRPEYPLGVLFDGGVHELACQARLFGVPDSVQAVGRSYRQEYGEYDHVAMFLQYENEVLGVFTHSGFLNGKRDYFLIRGTEGLIYLDDKEFVLEEKRGHVEELTRPSQSPHEVMWDHLTECLSDLRPARYSSRNALREIETLTALEQAVHSGTSVSVQRSVRPS
jgi:predicted dehydrogenase